MLEKQHVLVGGAIAGLAMIAFFVWGVQFELFGSEIDFQHRPVPTLMFFGWLLVGIFGAGYMFGGSRAGAKMALRFALLAGAAGVIGVALGNYQ